MAVVQKRKRVEYQFKHYWHKSLLFILLVRTMLPLIIQDCY